MIYEVFDILSCGFWNQVSYDHRSYAHNLSNCVEKPEKVSISTGFESVTSPYRYDAQTDWAMKPLTLGAGHLWLLIIPWGMSEKWYMNYFIYWNAGFENPPFNIWIFSKPAVKYLKYFIYHFSLIPHGLIRTHKWPPPKVSGFIAQSVRTSHRCREVTGSNPVEVLTSSGFSTQLLKLRSSAPMIIAYLMSVLVTKFSGGM